MGEFYIYFRQYDPRTVRCTPPDPIGWMGGIDMRMSMGIL